MHSGNFLEEMSLTSEVDLSKRRRRAMNTLRWHKRYLSLLILIDTKQEEAPPIQRTWGPRSLILGPRSSTPKLLGPHSASISQPNENVRQELLAPAHQVPPTNRWMFNISSSISPTKELQPRSRFFSCIQQERLHKTGLADVCFF